MAQLAYRANRAPPVLAVVSGPVLSPEAESNKLAFSMLGSSVVPVLLLDANLVVLAASPSFCQAFRLDPKNVDEHEIFELGRGEWEIPQLRTLLRLTAAGVAQAVEPLQLDLKRAGMKTLSLSLTAVRRWRLTDAVGIGDDGAFLRSGGPSRHCDRDLSGRGGRWLRHRRPFRQGDLRNSRHCGRRLRSGGGRKIRSQT